MKCPVDITEAKPLTSYSSHAPNTSKMWILPDGKVVSIFVQHYEWALANAERLRRDYGINLNRIARREDTPIRLHLLSKGSVRVNYEHRGGKLTVEANHSTWGDVQKSAYLDIIKRNVGDIDFICLRLLTRTGKIKDEHFANLVGLSDRQKQKQVPIPMTALSPQRKKPLLYT